MKYAYLLQLSTMLLFWTMLALAVYAANGSASRAAIARYTQSDGYTFQLLMVCVMTPLLHYFFGPSFPSLVITLSSGIEQPSLAAAYAVFTLATIILSLGFLAFGGGLVFRNWMSDLFAPTIAQEPEPQASTAS
jgi:hypothetical protein